MTNQAIPEPAPYVLPAEIRRAVKFPTPGRLATLNVADCELLAAEFDRLTAENETLRADRNRRQNAHEALRAEDWQAFQTVALQRDEAREERDRLAGQVQAVRDFCSALEYAANSTASGPVAIVAVRLREIVGGVS